MSRKILIIVLIPAVLLLSGYLYIRTSLHTAIKKEEKQTGRPVAKADTLDGKKVSSLDLRPLLIERLKQVLNHSSNGLYNLSVGDLKIDVLASKLSLRNVTVKPIAQALKSGRTPANVFSVSFKGLDIDGVNIDDVLKKNIMEYKTIHLIDPVIEIMHKRNTEKENDEVFAERFLKEMKKLSIGKLIIDDGTLVINNGKKEPLRLNHVQVNMNDILIDSATRHDHQRFLFASSALIRFKDYHSKTKDGRYDFQVHAVTIKAPQQQVQLDDVSFASPLDKLEFTRQQKLATEWYNLKIPSLMVDGVNWWHLINEEEVVAKEVITKNGRLAVYFDRSLPAHNVMGHFPNQILTKLPMKMNVQRIRMQNLDVSYEERSPTDHQTGTIYFDHLNIDMAHVSNKKSNRQPAVVTGTGLFMHQIPMRAQFVFSAANAQSGAFTATVTSHTPFAGSLVNSFAMPLGLAKVEKGALKELSAGISGDQSGASGNVLMLYNDLKLSILEKDKKDNGLNKKHITSFFANAFVLRNDNPKSGEAPRKETASFKRDPTGGFFMLVWKTILVGALKTIGAPEKIASK
jgi:hypothetical protein